MPLCTGITKLIKLLNQYHFFFNTLLLGLIVGADLVEFNPDRDVDNITASVSAKIMKELAGKIILSQSAQKRKLMDPLFMAKR